MEATIPDMKYYSCVGLCAFDAVSRQFEVNTYQDVNRLADDNPAFERVSGYDGQAS